MTAKILPLRANKAFALLEQFDKPWFVAGGWALDLFLGRQTRDHTDIEIAIFREDQLALQRILKGWRLELSTKEGRRIWQPGEWLQLPLHEIHTYDSDNDGVEFLLNEKSDSEWVFRRNKAVKREISALTMYTQDGIPFFGPEIVLLYKAGEGRDRDELDMTVARDQLDDSRRDWLCQALTVHLPDHPWTSQLSLNPAKKRHR